MFRTYRRSNKVLGVWHMHSPGPLKLQVEPDPYRYAGWRDVGITSHMVIEVGKILGMPVYVLHNDQTLYEFIPTATRSRAPRRAERGTSGASRPSS